MNLLTTFMVGFVTILMLSSLYPPYRFVTGKGKVQVGGGPWEVPYTIGLLMLLLETTIGVTLLVGTVVLRVMEVIA